MSLNQYAFKPFRPIYFMEHSAVIYLDDYLTGFYTASEDFRFMIDRLIEDGLKNVIIYEPDDDSHLSRFYDVDEGFLKLPVWDPDEQELCQLSIKHAPLGKYSWSLV